MEINWKSYFSPTPRLFRKIGDSMLLISQSVAGVAIVTDNKKIALLFMIVGLIGKFLTNFFTDDPVQAATDTMNRQAAREENTNP